MNAQLACQPKDLGTKTAVEGLPLLPRMEAIHSCKETREQKQQNDSVKQHGAKKARYPFRDSVHSTESLSGESGSP